eukprot:TRINITY_DN1463_c0_g1_i2.p1 TRINITY_DN1463_c0_g1~~TRINITY_DN1463_c0_g1_i2.p1  ORF type:complete len:158 (+),score=25.88 TRINITY_DN1463_c0_g1_i2:205-678(+)
MKVLVISIAVMVVAVHSHEWVAFDRCNSKWMTELHGTDDFDCTDPNVLPVPDGFQASLKTLMAVILATNDIPCDDTLRPCRPDRIAETLKKYKGKSVRQAIESVGLAVSGFYGKAHRVKHAIEHGKLVIINVMSDTDLCVLGLSCLLYTSPSPRDQA